MFDVVDGDIITSCGLGKTLLGSAEGFQSAIGQHLVEASRALFIDTNVG